MIPFYSTSNGYNWYLTVEVLDYRVLPSFFIAVMPERKSFFLNCLYSVKTIVLSFPWDSNLFNNYNCKGIRTSACRS